MSLVKKAQLTSRKLRANRRNGRKATGPKPNPQKSRSLGRMEDRAPAREDLHPRGTGLGYTTGPEDQAQRSTAAKTDLSDLLAILGSSKSAVEDLVCPQSIRAALVAMDEDPGQFVCLHQELIDEWQPSTPTLRKLVLRLAYLMWRQERAQRAQDGLMLRRMNQELAVRTQRMLDGSRAQTQLPTDKTIQEGGLRQAEPSEAKFKRLLDWLEWLMRSLDTGDLSDSWEIPLQQIYGAKPTCRGDSIFEYARQLAEYFESHPESQAQTSPPEQTAEANGRPTGGGEATTQEAAEEEPEVDASGSDDEGEEEEDEEDEDETSDDWKPPLESISTDSEKDEILHTLRRELAAEHRDVTVEYKLYRALNIDFPWHLRASLFAPNDKYWGTAIWQEQSLGQEIERTLRLIVSLQTREWPGGGWSRGDLRRGNRARR